MKIVTVNVQESILEAIKKLIGPGGLYPSRSELVRVATREFLLKELKLANSMAKYNKPDPEPEEEFDAENFVRVPIESLNEKSEPIREFKTYKILKQLDFSSSEETPKNTDHGEFLGKTKYGDSFDDIPQPSKHIHQSFAQQRIANPNLPDYRFINERLI